MLSHEINLLKAAMHPINFCTSWRLSGGFILVIADTFSGLETIPRRETIYPSNFHEDILNVHFSGFTFILKCSHIIKSLCQVKDESIVFLSLYDHVVNIRFNIAPKL
jgi:hypothetical protein